MPAIGNNPCSSESLHQFGYFQRNSNCLNAQLYKDGTQTNRIFDLLLFLFLFPSVFYLCYVFGGSASSILFFSQIYLSLSCFSCLNFIFFFSFYLFNFYFCMLLFYLNVNQYPIRVFYFFLSQKSWERFMCKTILAAESVMVILLS